MTGIVPIRRTSGILNQQRHAHTTLHGSSVRPAHIPNFEAVKRYIEFISIEFNALIENEYNDIYEPAFVNIATLVENCDLPYKNLHHFLMIITEDGKYGEFEDTTNFAHLTKQALFNILRILGENTQEFFLEKNLINVSDIQRKANKVILDKKNLVALIVSRGLDSLTGLSPSMMITSVVKSFKEGIHYTKSEENRYNRSGAIVLTSEGIEFLARGVNQQVLFLLKEDAVEEKIAA